jgi:hypothetical protein
MVFTSFLSLGQKTSIYTMPPLENKQVINLNDTIFRNRSIIFFLPIDNYDTTIWNNSILNFVNKLNQKDDKNLTIYKYFFDPGNCDKCGVKVLNNKDTLNNCSIYFPSCFISGYSQNLIERAQASKALNNYGFKSINNTFSIAQISFKNSPMCIEKPIGESDFDVWRPFIQEVFYPNYSTDEKVELLIQSNSEFAKIITDLKSKILQLEAEVNVLKSKPELTKEVAPLVNDNKQKKTKKNN